jgi:hypothetical protein
MPDASWPFPDRQVRCLEALRAPGASFASVTAAFLMFFVLTAFLPS